MAVGAIIGRGAYAIVRKYEDPDIGPAVIKICRVFSDMIDWKRALREAYVVWSLRNSSYIVKAIDILSSSSSSQEPIIAMVFEKYHTDLFQMNQKKILTSTEIKKIMFQLVESLYGIHAAGLVHGDMKLSNVFINEDLSATIGDFNGAFNVSSPPADEQHMPRMTQGYRAPECLLSGLVSDQGKRYDKIDVWGLGIIFAELLDTSGKLSQHVINTPSDPTHQLRLIINLIGSPDTYGLECLKSYLGMLSPFEPIVNNPFAYKPSRLHEIASGPALTMVTKMLSFDPKKRPTALELYNDPYFQEFDHNTLLLPPYRVDLSHIDRIKTVDGIWESLSKLTNESDSMQCIGSIDLSNLEC